MFLPRELGGFSGDLRFVMKFPKSPPINRNRENLGKSPRILSNGHFSAGLWAQKTPCTRAIRDPKREFLCIEDSGAEQSEFELPVPILEQPDDSWLFLGTVQRNRRSRRPSAHGIVC